MKLPDTICHSIECPSCSNDFSKLEWQKDISGNDYLAYNCSFCKQSWTTTESDEISIKYRNIKKRSIKRKNKINKINSNEL